MSRMDLSKCWPVPQRYVLSLMGFLAILNAYTMRACLSIAMTEMVDPKQIRNQTIIFDWSPELQGHIKGAFFYGYVITHIPGAWLCERFGGKHVLSLGILSTAIFSILTPITTMKLNSHGLIILRVLMGLGEGTTFPALSSLLSSWIPARERARLGSFVFGGGQIGSILGNYVSGIILKNNSWEFVFYLWGIIAIVWYIFFIFLCYSSPEDHPFIRESEKEYLRQRIHDLKRGKELPPTPWTAILTSVPMMALVSAQIGHDWGFYIMAIDLPKYFKDVHKANVEDNGLYTALPFLVMWIFSTLSSFACDYIINNNYITVTNARKAFTGVAAVIPAILLVGAAYAGSNETLIVTLFSLGMGFMGLWYPGMKVNPLDLSPSYASTIMAVTNGIGALAGAVAPIVVGMVTNTGSIGEWQIMFWITFVIFIVTTISYTLWASAEIQPWNDPVIQDKTSKKTEGGKESGVAELGGADDN